MAEPYGSIKVTNVKRTAFISSILFALVTALPVSAQTPPEPPPAPQVEVAPAPPPIQVAPAQPAPVRQPQVVAPPPRTAAPPPLAPPNPGGVGSTELYASKPDWSPIGAQTLSFGRSAIATSIGWPGFELGYQFGILPDLNLGALITVDWGFSYNVSNPMLGFSVIAPIKWQVVAGPRFSFSLNAGIGPGFHWVNTRPQFGLSFPLGARLGIAITNRFGAVISLDFPMYFTFKHPLASEYPTQAISRTNSTNTSCAYANVNSPYDCGTATRMSMPVLIGGGVEYFITDKVVVFGRFRFGPAIDFMLAPYEQPSSGTVDMYNLKTTVGFAIDVAIGAGYRF